VKITGDQVKTARFILGWKQSQLASTARISTTTVSHFENGTRVISDAAISEIRFVLEKADIEFTSGSDRGVKLRNVAK
jgi:transcriptional regulator with XRE-family HTH domain